MTTSIREEYKIENERRTRFLTNLIKEAVVNTIAEQQMPPPPPPIMADPTSAAQPAPPAPADPNAMPAAPGGQPEEFTLDKMIEKLNVIRGGRSFTDPEIYGQLTTMFKTWDDPTKQLVEKTFDEMAKVVTLNADAASNPSEQPTAPPAPAQPPMAPPAPAMPPAMTPPV